MSKAKKKRTKKRPKKGTNPVGRPPLYKTPEAMAKKIDEYFKWCDGRQKKYTVPGMAYYLGFCDRHALAEIANTKSEFSATISRARLLIESQRMEDVVSGAKGMSTHGMEFDLKCNFGYVPKEAIEHSGEGNLTVTYAHRGQEPYDED